MPEQSARLGLHQPATYQLRVQGELDQEWLEWFDELSIAVESGVTTLTGTVPDQPALHGLLIKIRDVGLPLLLVILLSSRNTLNNWSSVEGCKT